MSLTRKINQEELVTQIEETIAGLEVSLKAYREFMALPLAVQICSERDEHNIGLPEETLITLLMRELEIDEETVYRDHIAPYDGAGLIRIHMPGKGNYFLQSDEMYATLEPIRVFKRRVEAKEGRA